MTVYEVSNSARKEFYVCASKLSLEELMRAHCAKPPSLMGHWVKGDGIYYEPVESFPSDAEARSFVKKYADVVGRTGWKVLVEP